MKNKSIIQQSRKFSETCFRTFKIPISLKLFEREQKCGNCNFDDEVKKTLLHAIALCSLNYNTLSMKGLLFETNVNRIQTEPKKKLGNEKVRGELFLLPDPPLRHPININPASCIT